MSVYQSGHLYVHTSVRYYHTAIHPSVCPLGHPGGHLCVCQDPCFCQYSHLSIGPVVDCIHLWIYRYHVNCSFHHSSYCCWVQWACVHVLWYAYFHQHFQGWHPGLYKSCICGVSTTPFTVHIFSHMGSSHSCFSL